MNRLKGTRGYLGGGIEFMVDLGVEWREQIIKETKELEINWLDPCNKPIDIGIEDLKNHEIRKKLKKEGRFDEVAQEMRIVRCVDLRMVDISDFLVVNIDVNAHTCGTYEELNLANRQKKPIIVRIKQGKECTPDWLLGTIPHQMIFSTWVEVLGYLKHIARDSSIYHHKRWYFFDFEIKKEA